jgi:endonuclease
MITAAQAIRAYVESADGPVTADQVKEHIQSEYPERWTPNTVQAHLSACVVNNPKAYIHHPSIPKFLYRNSDGTFEMYSETAHGPNEWAPGEAVDEASDAAELAETTISLERDIEDHLVHHLEVVEKGLKLIGRQVTTEIGRIDILAEDVSGGLVIIEVKVGPAKDSAIGQVARYLGWYLRTDPRPTRAILIAASFSEGVRYAAAAVPNLTLLAYRVHFSFEPASVQQRAERVR